MMGWLGFIAVVPWIHAFIIYSGSGVYYEVVSNPA